MLADPAAERTGELAGLQVRHPQVAVDRSGAHGAVSCVDRAARARRRRCSIAPRRRPRRPVRQVERRPPRRIELGAVERLVDVGLAAVEVERRHVQHPGVERELAAAPRHRARAAVLEARAAAERVRARGSRRPGYATSSVRAAVLDDAADDLAQRLRARSPGPATPARRSTRSPTRACPRARPSSTRCRRRGRRRRRCGTSAPRRSPTAAGSAPGAPRAARGSRVRRGNAVISGVFASLEERKVVFAPPLDRDRHPPAFHASRPLWARVPTPATAAAHPPASGAPPCRDQANWPIQEHPAQDRPESAESPDAVTRGPARWHRLASTAERGWIRSGESADSGSMPRQSA